MGVVGHVQRFSAMIRGTQIAFRIGLMEIREKASSSRAKQEVVVGEGVQSHKKMLRSMKLALHELPPETRLFLFQS